MSLEINTMLIDSSLTKSELCMLGRKHSTDKSPLNTVGHRHSYTGLYNLLFAGLKHKKICLGEVGILNNASMKCWRDFFPNSKLIGYDYDQKHLQKAKQDNICNADYHFIDIKSSDQIKSSLDAAGELFDVLIEDSTHEFEDQIRFINVAFKYLKPDGILIIEDIFKHFDENDYRNELKHVGQYFSHASFFITEHNNQFSDNWNNDKLLILFRNNV